MTFTEICWLLVLLSFVDEAVLHLSGILLKKNVTTQQSSAQLNRVFGPRITLTIKG